MSWKDAFKKADSVLSAPNEPVDPTGWSSAFSKIDSQPLDNWDLAFANVGDISSSPTAVLQTSFDEYQQIKQQRPDLTSANINKMLVNRKMYGVLKDKYPALEPADINKMMVDLETKGGKEWVESLGDISLKQWAIIPEITEQLDVIQAISAMEEYDEFNADPITMFKSYGYSEDQIMQPGFDPLAPISHYTGEQIIDKKTGKTERQRQLELVENYIHNMEKAMAEEELRGRTIGGYIAKGVAESIPFVLEFALTKGAASGMKKGAIEAAKRMAQRGITGKAAGVGLRVGSELVKRTIQTVMQPGTYEQMLDNVLSNRYIKDGEVHLRNEGISDARLLLEGFADRAVENVSEAGVYHLLSGPKSVITKAINKIKGGGAVGRGFIEGTETLHKRAFPKTGKGDAISSLLGKLGIHGFTEEWLEERFGGLMRDALGLPGGGILPASVDEALIELGVLAIPAGARRVALEIANHQIQSPEGQGKREQTIEQLENARMLVRNSPEITDEDKEIMYGDLDRQIELIQNRQPITEEPIQRPEIEPVLKPTVEQVIPGQEFVGEGVIPETRILTPHQVKQDIISEGQLGVETRAEGGFKRPVQVEFLKEKRIAKGGQEVGTPEPIPQAEVVQKKVFKEPTLLRYFTPVDYYAQKMGVDYITKPLQKGSEDITYEYLKGSRDIDETALALSRTEGEGKRLQRGFLKRGETTPAQKQMALWLNEYEDAPEFLTEDQTAAFNYYRALTRSMHKRTNAVRRELGEEEIPYTRGYFKHVLDVSVEDVIEGRQAIPEKLKVWWSKNAPTNVYNDAEFKRKLGRELEILFSSDLASVMKSMLWTSLREMHLKTPLKFFKQEMKELGDVMPESVQKWLNDIVNTYARGQRTDFDKSVERLVKATGLNTALNRILKPFGRALSNFPVSKALGRIVKWSYLGGLGFRLKPAIRNVFQRNQELALHPVKIVAKAQFFPDDSNFKRLLNTSRLWRGYTGIEEIPNESLKKLSKVAMAPFQFSARRNARFGLKASYYDITELITNSKYKGFGWADPKRTYKEEKGFLYDSEWETLVKEADQAASATQYKYTAWGLPELWKHKTAKGLTTFQSWWLNYFLRFHQEAIHRAFTGRTRDGKKLPWNRRMGHFRYLIMGGFILQSLGYSASFLVGVLPRGMPPLATISLALYFWLIADDDRERKRQEQKIINTLPVVLPYGLSVKEAEKVWEGDRDLEELFIYEKGIFADEEEE